MNPILLVIRRSRTERLLAWWCLLLSLVALVWRTSAAGSEEGWTARRFPGGSILDLALSGDGKMVVAAGTTGTQVSRDSGRSWQETSLPSSADQVAISVNGTTLLAANATGAWVSRDFGVLWTQVWTGEMSTVALSGDGRTMAGFASGTLRLSTNSGGTWSAIKLPTNPPEADLLVTRIAMSDDGLTIVASSIDALHISHNLGKTWKHITKDLPETWAVFAPWAISSDGKRLFATVASDENINGLRVSDDDGATWKQISWFPTQDSAQHISTLAVSGNGQHLIAGSYFWLGPAVWAGPIYQSSDAGGSWTQLDPRLYQPRDGESWLSPEHGRYLALSSDGSVQLIGIEGLASIPVTFPPGPLLSFGVAYPPEIRAVEQSGDLELNKDLSLEFRVVASGSQLRFQWRRDGTNLADAPTRTGTGSSRLDLLAATTADLGTYSVVVSNAEGSVEQEVFTLKLETPTVSNVVQTGSKALVDGAPVAFSVTASGGLLSFQWRKNGLDLTDAPGRTGTRTRELKLDSTSAADLGTYSVVVSNAIGSLAADAGELKLTLPRLVTAEPPSGPAVMPGASTRLQIQVEGGEIEVEWLLNGVPLNRSGTGSGPGVHWIELTNIQTADVGEYSARLRNPAGEVVVKVAQVSQASWQRANIPAAAWNSVAMSASGDRILVSSTDRVMASLEGRTWEPMSAPGTDWTSVALGAESGTVILGQGTSLLDSLQPTSGCLSADFGQTWRSWTDPGRIRAEVIWRTKSVACSADGKVLFISQDNTTYVGHPPFPSLPMPESRLRISHDGGQTWNTANASAPADLWRSVSISSDGRILAAVSRQFYALTPWEYSIHVSTDSGVHWRSVPLAPGMVRSVAVSGDGRRVVAIVGDGLYDCDPTVLDWRRIHAPAGNWSAVCLTHNGQRIFAADYGSDTGAGVIHQSDDGGQTWRWSGSPTANWTAVACSADGERVVGASSQGLFLAPSQVDSMVSAIPLPATNDTSGLHFHWQGTPHRTYRLLSTTHLGGRTWQSAGAAVADPEGRVSVSDGANASQRFWQAMEAP